MASKQIQNVSNQKPGSKQDDDNMEGKASFRQYLENHLTGKYGRYIDYLSTFLSLFSFVIHIISTYEAGWVEWYEDIDVTFVLFYFFQYILQLFTAQHRFIYLISFQSIVDLITIFPLFMINNSNLTVEEYQIIKISRIIRILRVVRVLENKIKTIESEMSNVSRQIFTINLTVLSLIFVFSAVLLVFEAPSRQISIEENLDIRTCSLCPTPATFHEMIYFIIVTFATVGYGDVNPTTENSRLCVIFLIIIVIVIIPKQTNELIRLMEMQSHYARAFYKYNMEIPHIIITGHVGVSALKNFCHELFHPDHGQYDKNAIILQQQIPGTKMEIFLHDPSVELFLTYLQGNPMNDKDLRRASATKARACVILTNKYMKESQSADHKNILIALVIKKFVHYVTNGENIRLCMQLIKPLSKTHYYSSLNTKSIDQLIVVEEIKMNLLAKSCFSPGIISMIGNLIASAGEQNTEQYDDEWIKEYIEGKSHEIYRTELSPKFQGKQFSQIAADVFSEYSGIIFGIEIEANDQTVIRLNPGPYHVPNTTENSIHVYIICEDKKIADLVATHEMSIDEQVQYQLTQQQIKLHKKEKIVKKDKEYDEIVDEFEQETDFEIEEDDESLIKNDYVLLNEPISLTSVSPGSIRDSDTIINHIVVCGYHPSIYYFILPLRAKYLKEFQYIVLLCPEHPTEIWESINRFTKVIYIKGSPLLCEDLVRANINYADKAVVLGKDLESSKVDPSSQMDEMFDAESIFIYKAIKKCNKNVQIMVELVYSDNIEFLLPKNDSAQEQQQKYDDSPLYAAGEVYISSIIDTVTCQSYYNPHIVTILQQILTGGKQSNAKIRGFCDESDLKQSNLWQISVPEDYLNKSFGELFNYLCKERHLIPLGLYRLPGALDNEHPYVFTNPDESIKLTHRDKVFILSFNMPNDLLSGGDQNINLAYQAYFNSQKNQNVNLVDNQLIRQVDKIDLKISKKQIEETPAQKVNRDNYMNSNNKNEYIESDDQQIKKYRPIDMENMNLNTATYFVLDQVNQQIASLKEEIENIKTMVNQSDEQILEKLKISLKNEIHAITQ